VHPHISSKTLAPGIPHTVPRDAGARYCCGSDLRRNGVSPVRTGRRTAHHPASQTDDELVPVLTYNANTIPVANLNRVDVLLNGASAIYGADAVAGVVNNVLRDDIDGGRVSLQYGMGEGT